LPSSLPYLVSSTSTPSTPAPAPPPVTRDVHHRHRRRYHQYTSTTRSTLALAASPAPPLPPPPLPQCRRPQHAHTPLPSAIIANCTTSHQLPTPPPAYTALSRRNHQCPDHDHQKPPAAAASPAPLPAARLAATNAIAIATTATAHHRHGITVHGVCCCCRHRRPPPLLPPPQCLLLPPPLLRCRHCYCRCHHHSPRCHVLLQSVLRCWGCGPRATWLSRNRWRWRGVGVGAEQRARRAPRTPKRRSVASPRRWRPGNAQILITDHQQVVHAHAVHYQGTCGMRCLWPMAYAVAGSCASAPAGRREARTSSSSTQPVVHKNHNQPAHYWRASLGAWRPQGPEILDLGGGQAAPRWPPWPTSDPPGCWRWDGVNMAK
jgi:hypothetical protein